MRHKLAALIGLTLAMILFSATPSQAWLYFHKPAFKGQVLDAETKKPLEGVAVEVVYEMRTFGLGPESGTEPFDVREAVTDNNGMFYVPSYTAVIRPNAMSECANIIFYKPGYGGGFWPASIASYYIGVGCDERERFFCENFGKEGELLLDLNPGKLAKFGGGEGPHKVIFGIVQLPRLKTREERWKAVGSPVYPEFRHKTPVLNKLEAEEEKFLGIDRRHGQ